MNTENSMSNSEQILVYVKTIIHFALSTKNKKLKQTNPGEYRGILLEKFNDFFEKYPSMFNTIIDDPEKFDINRLIRMLNQKDRVANNEISYEDASKKVGQEYYDEFVKQKVEKL